MASKQRPTVPKFGNWETEESVPYTVVFNNARKNRGGKMINPNDPLEYPDMFPNMDLSPPAPAPSKRPEEPITRGAVKPTPDHRVSREDFDFRKSSNSPARSENMVQKSSNESTHRNYGGRGAMSNGPARQIERPPLNPRSQDKVAGRGNGSPSLEGKNSYDSSHGNPGRSQLRPVTRGDETPERSAAVPKFGIWKDNDPQSAENVPQHFKDDRKGRNTGRGNISGTPKHTSYDTQSNNNQKKCCFPWF